MKKSVPLGRAFPTRSLLKILTVMKLTIFLILLATFQVKAHEGRGQSINVSAKNTEIRKVLKTIEREGSYRFLYNYDLKGLRARVDINVANGSLKETLDQLFSGNSLTYKLVNKNLVVVLSTNAAENADVRITGRITGGENEPLAGVSIQQKGSSTGTTTNNNGEYALTVADDATLIISAIGYETQELSVSGKTVIDVKLVPAIKQIDQVVVIGYGSASKRDLTGSIVKISGKDVADKPNTNPVASLQGKVAGLQVTPYGTPGKQPDIRIRGTISIGSIRPWYVVDGILNDNIDFLNPNDIESIEILKDPSSLAIFGVKGASGIIAVTTKKAKAGQMIVNVNSSVGFKKLVDKIKVLTNGADFKTLYEEENNNIGAPNTFDFSKWQNNTDWIDAMTQTGVFNNNNVSITSSTDKNRFYMGLGYIKDEGIVIREKLQKIVFNFSDELKVSKAIKIGINFNGTRTYSPNDGTGSLETARRIAPIVSAGTRPFKTKLYGSDSVMTDLYSAMPSIQASALQNPLLVRENTWDKYIGRENRMVGNVYAEIAFLKNFTFRSTWYADMSNLNSTTYTPLYAAYDPAANPGSEVFLVNQLTKVSVDEAKWNKYQQDYILTYKKAFGDHAVTATGGFTTYYRDEKHLYGNSSQSPTGNPIPNDRRFWYVSNGFEAQESRQSSTYQKEEFQVSGLFRLLYNYKSKYFLNGSYRRDASSVIANPATRAQNFWAVGAAWEISKENFMATQNVFNYLRLKGSIGVLGNQNSYGIDYPYYPTLSSGNSAVFGNTIFPSYVNVYTPQPDLKWEEVHAKEVGVEGNAFSNRMHFEFNYYDKKTKDMWAYLQNGPNKTLGNFGTISNRGFEGMISWEQKLTNDLSLNVSGNITTYKNKVEKFGTFLPAGESNPNQTEVGFPIGYFYGYVVEGVYQSYADKLGSPKVIGYEYGPGDLKYRDINGDGQIDTKDRTLIGNPTPDFTYGASVSLRFKGFDFGMDFNGVYGNEVYRVWGSSELPYTRYNYPEFKMNRWHGEGTSNWVPILGDNHAINRLPSTFGIEDGSYFRIRNIQLGYNFPTKLLNRVDIKNLRLYANVQNLKTWKRNMGYTPEFGGGPTDFGLDYGNGPVPLIFTTGINITF